jgi:hypothetical protein
MVVHGFVLSNLLLLALASALIGLTHRAASSGASVRFRETLSHLGTGTWVIAVIATWLSVLTGTYIIYPWYRAAPSAGTDLLQFPKAYLLADPTRAEWHTFAMEWKEHVAWIAAMIITAVAFVVIRSGPRLAADQRLRRALLALLAAAILAAGVAGIAGAVITAIAPVR